MKKILLWLLFLQASLLLPAVAPAAETWVIPADTPVTLLKNVKATAILSYSDPNTGKFRTIKYTVTSFAFSLDRSVDPLATSFTLKGGGFQISAAMQGGGLKNIANRVTTVSASAGDPAGFTLSDTVNGLSWASDPPNTIMAGAAGGSFTENIDKTRTLTGTINFKLIYTITGTLSDGSSSFPGKMVVTFTGSKLAGI